MTKYLQSSSYINEKIIEKDINFKKIIDNDSCIKIELFENEFLSLVHSIIGQQLSGKASQSIFNRVLLFFDDNITPDKILDSKDEDLRELGLSFQKIKYLKSLSISILNGEVLLEDINEKSNDEIISMLTRVKGIGEWTAQMFLIFTLGREDVFSPADNGLQRAVKSMYNLEEIPDKNLLNEISEKWKPYRTFASLYLWESLNNR